MKVAVITGSRNDQKMIKGILDRLDKYVIELENFESPGQFQEKFDFGKDVTLLIIVVDSPHTNPDFSESACNFYLENQNVFSCSILLVFNEESVEAKLRGQEREGHFIGFYDNINPSYLDEILDRINYNREKPKGVKMKILLLAKQGSFAENLAKKLRDQGNNVKLFFNTRYVLVSDLSNFDLIIVDSDLSDMPGMNDMEVIQKVIEKNSKIKAILLTDGLANLVIIDKGGEHLSDIENYINKM